jgi:hypothetical protein
VNNPAVSDPGCSVNRLEVGEFMVLGRILERQFGQIGCDQVRFEAVERGRTDALVGRPSKVNGPRAAKPGAERISSSAPRFSAIQIRSTLCILGPLLQNEAQFTSRAVCWQAVTRG